MGRSAESYSIPWARPPGAVPLSLVMAPRCQVDAEVLGGGECGDATPPHVADDERRVGERASRGRLIPNHTQLSVREGMACVEAPARARIGNALCRPARRFGLFGGQAAG